MVFAPERKFWNNIGHDFRKQKKSRRKSPQKYFESQRFLTVGQVRETNNFLILAQYHGQKKKEQKDKQ